MSPEERTNRLVAAELLAYGRQVADLATKYSCPALLRWANRIKDDALAMEPQAELRRLTPALAEALLAERARGKG